jgi:hypothetical protein
MTMLDVVHDGRLDDLRRAVDALPMSHAADGDRNLRFVESLARAERFVARLEGLLEDDDALDVVARRSYRHVNHFDKIVLVDNDPTCGYRATLHLWKPPYTQAELREELIHDHRFNFWSAIVIGELKSINFRLAERGSRYRRYRYVAERLGHVAPTNFYEFDGEATLSASGVTRKLAGDAYFLPWHRIHRVLLPRAGMTCTLVLRGPREREFSNVYNTSYPPTDTQAANRAFSRQELARKLRMLSEAVAGRRDDRIA